MPSPQTQDAIPFGIPIRGMNTRLPLTDMPPDQTPWIQNFDCEEQRIVARSGYEIKESVDSAETICQVGWFETGDRSDSAHRCVFTYKDSDSKFRLYVNGSLEYTSSGTYAGSLNGDSGIRVEVLHWKGRIAFLLPDDYANSVVWDGTTASTWAFVDGGASAIGGLPNTFYRGRVWVATTTKLYYSSVGAVSGTLTTWDTDELHPHHSGVAWLGVLNTPEGTEQNNLFAYGTFDGTVLVYQGDYPGDTDTPWRQVGKFSIPRCEDYMNIVEFNNDLWIATNVGIVSLRALMSYGDDNEEIFVSRDIEGIWRKLWLYNDAIDVTPQFTDYRSIKICYDKNNNKVYVRMSGCFQNYADYLNNTVSNGITIFCYNVLTQAWYMHNMLNSSTGVKRNYDAASCLVANPTGAGGFEFCGDTYNVYGPSTLSTGIVYKDEILPAGGTYIRSVLAMHSAYRSFESFSRNKRVATIELVMKTDFDGSNLTMYGVADMGRTASPVGATPALEDGSQVAVYATSVKGTYIQYRYEGFTDTTSSDGLEIYSAGVSFK